MWPRPTAPHRVGTVEPGFSSKSLKCSNAAQSLAADVIGPAQLRIPHYSLCQMSVLRNRHSTPPNPTTQGYRACALAGHPYTPVGRAAWPRIDHYTGLIQSGLREWAGEKTQ